MSLSTKKAYIPTGEGWLYLAIVKDLCTRKYAFSDRIDTQLTLAALDMAYRRRRPAKGIIFHSDRGAQYAARAYRERLEAYGIRRSMSRKGDPYDNAVAENFFSCLKCELTHLKQYPTRAAAQNGCLSIWRPSTARSVHIPPWGGCLLHTSRLSYTPPLPKRIISLAPISFHFSPLFLSVFSGRAQSFFLPIPRSLTPLKNSGVG